MPPQQKGVFTTSSKPRVATALDVAVMKKLGDEKWRK